MVSWFVLSWVTSPSTSPPLLSTTDTAGNLLRLWVMTQLAAGMACVWV